MLMKKIYWNISTFIRMTGKQSFEKIKQNAEVTRQTLAELKNELSVVNKEYNIMMGKQLREENARLLAAVEEAKQKLIQLEFSNGIKQIDVPTQHQITESPVRTVSTIPADVPDSKDKPKKDKKGKKVKEAKESPQEIPVDVGRLDLRIGQVEDVQRHPDADSLYVLKINCGEQNPRTVCSGLVKHIPIDELKDRMVVLLCNLKPVKMRGITSEAMVMCASSEAGVEVLIPPSGCQAGDLVNISGYVRNPDPVMNPKKKIFETVAPDLHTNDNLQACYKDVPFEVVGKGYCVAKSLKNVPVK